MGDGNGAAECYARCTASKSIVVAGSGYIERIEELRCLLLLFGTRKIELPLGPSASMPPWVLVGRDGRWHCFYSSACRPSRPTADPNASLHKLYKPNEAQASVVSFSTAMSACERAGRAAAAAMHAFAILLFLWHVSLTSAKANGSWC